MSERLFVLIIWSAIVTFGSLIYLSYGFVTSTTVAVFVAISGLLGLCQRWVLRGAFALATIAILVALGFPHPTLWRQVIEETGVLTALRVPLSVRAPPSPKPLVQDLSFLVVPAWRPCGSTWFKPCDPSSLSYATGISLAKLRHEQLLTSHRSTCVR